MDVQLIAYTPEPEKLAATAARVCYSSQGAREILATIKDDKVKKRINDCVEKGHHSILEHATFSFSIEGISRVTSHQLVRHRLASYSQQSQRYVQFSGRDNYVIPGRIKENERIHQKYEEMMRAVLDFYEDMISEGIPGEDARYIIPSAICTSLVVSMNARELLHFFSLRCCKKAQWEIRRLAYLMLRCVSKVAPLIFASAGPACFTGECPQGDTKCFERMSRLRK
jgi:thymidylate synthase (FAD)